MTHGGGRERTSERDEGGGGGRLALGAPGTNEEGGEESATLTILSEQRWMRLLARAFCALRAVDGDHEREHVWRAWMFFKFDFSCRQRRVNRLSLKSVFVRPDERVV